MRIPPSGRMTAVFSGGATWRSSSKVVGLDIFIIMAEFSRAWITAAPAKSSHPNGQRMPEHISRVPPRLDLLQTRIVGVVIQGVPRDPRGIQSGVCKVAIGMIDECPIVGLSGDRHAPRLGKQIAIERANPCQILRFFLWIQP